MRRRRQNTQYGKPAQRRPRHFVRRSVECTPSHPWHSGTSMALTIQVNLSTWLQAIEVLGIVAFAMSGFIEARRREMDMVGIFTVGFITAFGGGTLRDLLLDQRPLFWVERQEYVPLIFVLALVTTP